MGVLKTVIALCYLMFFLSSTINSSDELRSLLPSTAGNCGKANPTISTDCTSVSWQQNYCCLMTTMDGANSFCNWIGPPTILPSMEKYTLEGVEYKVDCDIQEGIQGTPCSVVAPKELKECSKASTSDNSCCMYVDGDLTYCFWLGYKGLGSVVAKVTCYSSFLSSILITLLLLALF